MHKACYGQDYEQLFLILTRFSLMFLRHQAKVRYYTMNVVYAQYCAYNSVNSVYNVSHDHDKTVRAEALVCTIACLSMIKRPRKTAKEHNKGPQINTGSLHRDVDMVSRLSVFYFMFYFNVFYAYDISFSKTFLYNIILA